MNGLILPRAWLRQPWVVVRAVYREEKRRIGPVPLATVYLTRQRWGTTIWLN